MVEQNLPINFIPKYDINSVILLMFVNLKHLLQKIQPYTGRSNITSPTTVYFLYIFTLFIYYLFIYLFILEN
jgi:hypothetical protein